MRRHWAKSTWALHPQLCSDCGGPQSVCWTAWDSDMDKSSKWGLYCYACRPPESSLVDMLNYLLVAERPTSLAVVQPGHQRHPLDVHVWVRAGWFVPYAKISAAARGLDWLAEAREINSRSPQAKWALELRADGHLWAPWEPGDRSRRSPAGRFRTTVLRDSRFKRQCSGCRKDLRASETVYRPDDDCPWSGRSKRDTRVCLICAGSAHAHGLAQDGEVVVRHLRVIEGG